MRRNTIHPAITAAILLLSAATACTTSMRNAKNTAGDTVVAVPMAPVMNGGPGLLVGGSSQMLPRAVVYKTNGNYDDNVAVTLNAARTAIASYPAPSDITTGSTPVKVADGYLLDRRGAIGPNTAFLRYTYAQYAALKEVPDPAQLFKAIIPDAKVTQRRNLDISAWQAIQQPALVDSILLHHPND